MAFEVEFRNVDGEATAIGSAGPYTLASTVRQMAAVVDWASTVVSFYISPSVDASPTTCSGKPPPGTST